MRTKILTRLFSSLSLFSVVIIPQANAQTLSQRATQAMAEQSVNLCRSHSRNMTELKSCAERTYNTALRKMRCYDGECYWEVGQIVCVMNFAGNLQCHRKGNIDLDIIN